MLIESIGMKRSFLLLLLFIPFRFCHGQNVKNIEVKYLNDNYSCNIIVDSNIPCYVNTTYFEEYELHLSNWLYNSESATYETAKEWLKVLLLMQNPIALDIAMKNKNEKNEIVLPITEFDTRNIVIGLQSNINNDNYSGFSRVKLYNVEYKIIINLEKTNLSPLEKLTSLCNIILNKYSLLEMDDINLVCNFRNTKN